ncbi:MAG TPA: ABC-F family ATP-binding cassette domain-containing protein [Candidatus Saccharimonadales bacterium]|nr:ABC-F family ATP-binding cassette domain-containing protein [Candidatus Saccharimonadales bacterium]
MLLTVDIAQKSIGNKQLFQGLRFSLDDKEKVAIIGRNGVGKTTLFRMLTGEDTDYAGDIIFRKGIRIVATRQEHHDLGDQTVVDYIVQNLPEYAKLKQILDTYPETMGDDMRKITIYSEALDRFSQLDYYNVEDYVRRSLEDYQLGDAADRPMSSLSGGQKRFVELIRVEHSHADLALIDEPTNHMDYVAKEAFLKWFAATKYAVVVITHDRDLLQEVSRIIEVKDYTAHNSVGNYDAYLRNNTANTTAKINEYEVRKRTLENLHKQIQSVRAKKASTGKTPNPFIPLEKRLMKEYAELEAKMEKPTFWIDKESAENLGTKIEESYQKHKARTIHIRKLTHEERSRELLHLNKVQVGYNQPLFEPLNISVVTGEHYRIIGRNGVGKTTLVRTILDKVNNPYPKTLVSGKITLDAKLRINTYEQELDSGLLDLTLGKAIERIYEMYDLVISDQEIMRVLGDYLFDPYVDREQIVANLSGGQKARLQLVKLFVNKPNLIILDEPTNHLDLPSIEELENALSQYKGAMMYVSHDSYLSNHLGGSPIDIVPLAK